MKRRGFALAFGLGLGCLTNVVATCSAQPAEQPCCVATDTGEAAVAAWLQGDGMALLVCYLGIEIQEANIGVIDVIEDEEKPDETGDPKSEDEPKHEPEPASLILGLLGVTAATLSAARRRCRK